MLGLKAADRTVRNDINKATRATLNPVWRDLVARRARTRLDTRVIAAGARIAAGNPPAALAAQSKRKLPGGLTPVESWSAVEFGADQDTVTTYTRTKPRGGTTTVTRHTTRQLPARSPKGRVAYRALREIGPRATALWVQIIVRRFNDGAEKGGR